MICLSRYFGYLDQFEACKHVDNEHCLDQEFPYHNKLIQYKWIEISDRLNDL